MRIIWNECRKIYRPGIIIILILVTLLYYQVYMVFDIEHFPNGSPSTEDYELGLEYLDRFGTSIDEKELGEVKIMYDNIVKELDGIVQEKKLGQYNITNWNELVKMEDNSGAKYYEQVSEVYWNLIGEKQEYRTLIFKEQEIRIMLEDYRDGIRHGGGTAGEIEEYSRGSSGAYAERIQEIFSRDWIETMPYTVMDNYRSLFQAFCGLLVFTVIILVSPYLVRDKLNGMIPITYASKIGRSLFGKKILAVTGSAFLAILLQTFVFLIVYSRNKTAAFLHCLITTDINMEAWYDFTFGAYISITLIMAAGFGLCVSLICFFASKFCSNYIAVIALDVPMIAIAWSISSIVLGSVFYMHYNGKFPYIRNYEIYFIALIVMIGLATAELLRRREKMRDII